jgi:hypothetical protein
VFLVALAVSTLTIFIRSCYRVAELSKGFHGSLANNEVSFMILESTMVIIASLALTTLHPGLCFQGEWRAANFVIGKKGKKRGDLEGKRISNASSVLSEHDREPPVYSESVTTLSDDGASFEGGASVRVQSLRAGLRATTMRATPVRPGQVHVEMLPVYGVRYESTSDEFPKPQLE